MTPGREAYRRELREQGFVAGENVKEYRLYAEGHLDRLPALAAELVRQNVDVIVAVSTPAAQAAQQAATMKRRSTGLVWFFSTVLNGRSSVGPFAVRHHIPTIVNSRAARSSRG